MGTDNRIIDEKQFIEAIAAALIVAGTAAAMRRPLLRPYIVTAKIRMISLVNFKWSLIQRPKPTPRPGSFAVKERT